MFGQGQEIAVCCSVIFIFTTFPELLVGVPLPLHQSFPVALLASRRGATWRSRLLHRIAMTPCPEAIAACADSSPPVQQCEDRQRLWIGHASMRCTGGAWRHIGRFVECNDDVCDSQFVRDSVGLDLVRELVPEATSALAFSRVPPACGMSCAAFVAIDAGPDGSARTRDLRGCLREPGCASGARPTPAGCCRHSGARWPRGRRATPRRPAGPNPLRATASCFCGVPRAILEARDRPAESFRIGVRAAEQGSRELQMPGLPESSWTLSEPAKKSTARLDLAPALLAVRLCKRRLLSASSGRPRRLLHRLSVAVGTADASHTGNSRCRSATDDCPDVAKKPRWRRLARTQPECRLFRAAPSGAARPRRGRALAFVGTYQDLLDTVARVVGPGPTARGRAERAWVWFATAMQSRNGTPSGHSRTICLIFDSFVTSGDTDQGLPALHAS